MWTHTISIFVKEITEKNSNCSRQENSVLDQDKQISGCSGYVNKTVKGERHFNLK